MSTRRTSQGVYRSVDDELYFDFLLTRTNTTPKYPTTLKGERRRSSLLEIVGDAAEAQLEEFIRNNAEAGGDGKRKISVVAPEQDEDAGTETNLEQQEVRGG